LRIDAWCNGPYIAGHEQVVYDHDRREAPPPYSHGTDARSRVSFRAAGFAALFPKNPAADSA
jgi:hypothetical protein